MNPGIVYGSISGFGQDGPYGPRPGVDQIAQGMGGLMSITGLPGQGPVRVGIPIADLTAGGFLAQGVLIALLDREVTGVGRWVTTSLLEAQIAMLDFQAARWLIAGEVAGQAGNDHPTGIPTGLFPTKDDMVNIAASGQSLWERFCKASGMEWLMTDERFRGRDDRSRNRHELNALIAETTKTQTTAYWVETLNEAGVPCGPVNTIDRTFADPQVQHLRMATPMQHPALGEVKVVAQANNISGYKKDIRIATPDLGQQTDDILREMGRTPEQIAELRAAGVV